MQTSYSFDSQTMYNIAKGALHYLAVSVLLVVIDTLFQVAGQVHFTDPVVAAGFMFVIGNAYNVAKEWAKGQ